MLRIAALVAVTVACSSAGPSEPERPATSPVAYQLWDCRASCPDSAPLDCQRAPVRGGTIDDREAFEAKFGCSAGIDFAAQRVFVVQAGSINALPTLRGVGRTDAGELVVDVSVDRYCGGAAEDHARSFVVLLPAGDESVRIAERSSGGGCGSGPAPP